MAKYTELFSEYIEGGGALPSSFALINGFEDLFKIHFCDKEIGFETETLFTIKLEEVATLYMQKYADRISNLATWVLKINAPAKTHYTTTIYGHQKSETTELPIDSTTAEASLINDLKQHTNTNELVESGATSDEVIKMLNFLNSEVNNILVSLLRKFDNLFMKVY